MYTNEFRAIFSEPSSNTVLDTIAGFGFMWYTLQALQAHIVLIDTSTRILGGQFFSIEFKRA